jgi:hypothetical protein
MGHELKLRRAYHHLQDLDAKMTAWLDTELASVVTEPDPEHTGFFLVKVTASRPPADPFSLIIGDCIQNMRAALDQLAFSLASAYTVPLPDDWARKSQFPIFGDEDRQGRSGVGPAMFSNNGTAKIRGIDPAAQVIIERLQPYHQGQNFRTHPLWILCELSNIDKHRLIHPVVGSFVGVGITLSETGGFVTPTARAGAPSDSLQMEVFEGIVEGETVVARVNTRFSEEDDELKVDFVVPLRIVLEEYAPGDHPGESVVDTLTEIYKFICTDVFPPLSRYL